MFMFPIDLRWIQHSCLRPEHVADKKIEATFCLQKWMNLSGQVEKHSATDAQYLGFSSLDGTRQWQKKIRLKELTSPEKSDAGTKFFFRVSVVLWQFFLFFFFFFFLVFLHATQIFDGELSEVVERRLQRIQREQTLQGNWVVASIFLLHHWSALQSFRSKWMITA